MCYNTQQEIKNIGIVFIQALSLFGIPLSLISLLFGPLHLCSASSFCNCRDFFANSKQRPHDGVLLPSTNFTQGFGTLFVLWSGYLLYYTYPLCKWERSVTSVFALQAATCRRVTACFHHKHSVFVLCKEKWPLRWFLCPTTSSRMPNKWAHQKNKAPDSFATAKEQTCEVPLGAMHTETSVCFLLPEEVYPPG